MGIFFDMQKGMKLATLAFGKLTEGIQGNLDLVTYSLHINDDIGRILVR
jgi:hypothetical protein